MEQIELKIDPKHWIFFFLFFFTFATLFLYYIAGVESFQLLLPITVIGSVVVVAATIGIFYFYQQEVTLTEHGIKKVGYPSKSIAYTDIQKIKVGSSGFSIYDKGKTPINITTMYSNFDEAKSLLNRKIEDRSEIDIKGFKLFIDKHLDQQ